MSSEITHRSVSFNKDDKTQENHEKDNKTRRYDFFKKQFLIRRSPLTELIEDNIHVKGFAKIMLVFSLFLMFSLNYQEFVQKGRISPAFQLIIKSFSKLHIVFVFWLACNILTFICYYCFIFWARIRKTVSNSSIIDKFNIVLLIIYYGFIFYIIPYIIYFYNIPFASSCILLGESVRFLMKIHAFIRSNAPKVLDTDYETKLPTFSQYLYFLYAPTVVYKDEYPRTDKIRWSFAFYRFLEILWAILCQAHIFIHVITPIFINLCDKPMTVSQFLVLVFKSGLYTNIIMWMIFLCALHSSQNAVGELLRFGDRMFYSDWWNCRDMQEFYKKWNWVIGDWLNLYVNIDLKQNVFPKIPILAKILTIIISALVHEWIMTTITGFFCPVFLITMVLTIVPASFRMKGHNDWAILLVWMFYPYGIGSMAAVLFAEIFARQQLQIESTEMFLFWKQCVV